MQTFCVQILIEEFVLLSPGLNYGLRIEKKKRISNSGLGLAVYSDTTAVEKVSFLLF